MLKLDIGFFSTSLAIFMNNQDPQAPRKTKKNGVKNLKRAYPYHQLHLILNPLLRGLGRDFPDGGNPCLSKGLTSVQAIQLL
jgi:hypothetical protein